jgi:long-subunit fatty acid transport protein
MVDNISIARQICPQLSAGVGVDFITMCNQENVSKVYEGAVSPMTNYSFLDKQNDSGNGLQANVGLMYTPAPKWKTGFVYRTGTTINLGGSTSLNVNGLSAFGLGDYASAYTQSYYYPETYAVGASYDPSEKWTLAVAVLQNDYSPSRLDISYRNPQSSIGFVSTNISENDNNTTQYCLGAAYHYTPVWTFRAGVFNDPTQEPTNQLTIYNTNEFNMMYYSLGAGYTKGAIGLSLMLAYGMSDSPSVNGINYTYSTDILRAEAKYSF